MHASASGEASANTIRMMALIIEIYNHIRYHGVLFARPFIIVSDRTTSEDANRQYQPTPSAIQRQDQILKISIHLQAP